NARFPTPAPREEVCVAAEQHDLGMAAWDAAPALNPDTGRPQTFLEMAVATHLELWARAPRLARSQSRYLALLVSLHGTTLYRMRDLDREPPEVAVAIRGYFDDQRALQDELLGTLRDDPRYADHATPEAVDRNRRLVFALDGGRLPRPAASLRHEGAVEGARQVGWVRHDPEADLPRGPRAQGRGVELAPAAAPGEERGPGGDHLALGQGAVQPRLRADEV